jgi:hypothetical protein
MQRKKEVRAGKLPQELQICNAAQATGISVFQCQVEVQG